MNRILLFFMLLPCVSLAEVPNWKIMPNMSSLSFSAMQNGNPVEGSFTNFTGDINFDPNQLKASKVKIIVDMNSVTDSGQISDTLKKAEWFNVALFPQAIFQSSEFVKIDGNNFQAKGTLSIRDIKLPVLLMFTLEEFTKILTRIKGKAVIKRISFGVGQGQWADTSSVEDDVQINFTVTGRAIQ
jgi:polyisoprenoid-binding protein YceI